MLRPSIFIPPCEPTQRDRPPKDENWLHEVKFDGYRVQLHKAFRQVIIFTRNRHDWTDRFPRLAAEFAALPSCIIDAELVATDGHGIADFATLQRIVSKRQEDDLTSAAFGLEPRTPELRLHLWRQACGRRRANRTARSTSKSWSELQCLERCGVQNVRNATAPAASAELEALPRRFGLSAMTAQSFGKRDANSNWLGASSD